MAKKEELVQEATSLGVKTPNELTVAQLKEAIKEAKEATKPGQQSDDNDESSEELTFKVKGQTYTFDKDAPKTINVDGETLTQKEIAEDKSIREELVLGGCTFFKIK